MDFYAQLGDAFTQAITLGHAAVLPETHWLLKTLAVLAFVMIGISMTFGDGEPVPQLVRTILLVGFLLFVMDGWEPLANRFMDSFTQLGLLAGGSGLSAKEFLNSPDRIMSIGSTAAVRIYHLAKDSCGYGCLTNLNIWGSLFAVQWLIYIVFVLISFAVFATLMLFKISVLAATITLPLMVFPKTAHFGEMALTNVLRWGTQMMVLALITAVGGTVFQNVQIGDEPGFAAVEGITVAGIVFLGMVMASGKIATSLIAGTILHGGSMLAGGAGAAAVGARSAGQAGQAIRSAGVVQQGISGTIGAAKAMAAAMRRPPS